LTPSPESFYGTAFTLLIVLVVATVLMAYLATNVKLSYEAAKILPQTDSTYNEYLKIQKDVRRRRLRHGHLVLKAMTSSAENVSDWYDLSQEIKRNGRHQEDYFLGTLFPCGAQRQRS
jgi:predicted RND superfamily exporter protein